MTDNSKLLEFIYKNAEMGKQTLPKLIDISDNDEFRSALQKQLNEYEEIRDKAETLLKNDNSASESEMSDLGLNAFEKASTEIMLKINTLNDRSCPHVADMVLKGSSMGITDIAKQIERYRGAGAEAIELAERLRRSEEHNIDEMKKYLSLV